MLPVTLSKVLSHVTLHPLMKTFTQWHPFPFLHVLIRTHKTSFQVLYHKGCISAWSSDQQPRFILINKYFQRCLIIGLQNVPSINFEYGQIHHNLRINFAIHHDFLVTFPSFPTFLIPQNLRNDFPNLPLESVETCPILSDSLFLRSPTSSPRYRSNTSPM